MGQNGAQPTSSSRRCGANDHDPDLYDEFSRRYLAELEDPERAVALDHLRELAGGGPLTLLTATKRSDISEAAVLKDLLTG